MSRDNKMKMCRCGRGKLLSGEKSMFNYKDSQGKQICAQCVVDALVAPYKRES